MSWDKVIPLTVFANYLGRIVTLHMEDGTEKTGTLEAIESGHVYLWPAATPDRYGQNIIVSFDDIGGNQVAHRDSFKRRTT